MISKNKLAESSKSIVMNQSLQDNSDLLNKSFSEQGMNESISLENLLPVRMDSVHISKDSVKIGNENEGEDLARFAETKPVVALDGNYHEIDNRFFGGDGHYMKKIKAELNENNLLREENELAKAELGEEKYAGNQDWKRESEEEFDAYQEKLAEMTEQTEIPLQDYTPEMIRQVETLGKVEQIKAKFAKIANYCFKYRLFHPFPLTSSGKKRKAEVKELEARAKERIAACREQITKIKAEQENHVSRGIEDENAYGRALSGWDSARNYALAGTVGLLGNIWATVGMVSSTPFWLVASGIKSLAKLSPSSAFHIPHPQSFGKWYATFSDHWGNKYKEEEVEKSRKKDPERMKAPNNLIHGKRKLGKTHWHYYLGMVGGHRY